jgi:GNAT superfamily N-acetyltransferase
MLGPATPDSLLTMLEVRALSVDDLSTARYVVATAFTRGAKDHYSAAEVEAFEEFVRSPHYGDLLLGNRAYGAWVGSEMVGVAAWSTGEAGSPTARILAVFVHPLFGGNGIGTRLTESRGRGPYRWSSRAGDERYAQCHGVLRGARVYRDAARHLGPVGGAPDAHRLHAQDRCPRRPR